MSPSSSLFLLFFLSVTTHAVIGQQRVELFYRDRKLLMLLLFRTLSPLFLNVYGRETSRTFCCVQIVICIKTC